MSYIKGAGQVLDFFPKPDKPPFSLTDSSFLVGPTENYFNQALVRKATDVVNNYPWMNINVFTNHFFNIFREQTQEIVVESSNIILNEVQDISIDSFEGLVEEGSLGFELPIVSIITTGLFSAYRSAWNHKQAIANVGILTASLGVKLYLDSPDEKPHIISSQPVAAKPQLKAQDDVRLPPETMGVKEFFNNYSVLLGVLLILLASNK